MQFLLFFAVFQLFQLFNFLSQQDQFEHAEIFSETDKSDILTSGEFDKVEFDLGSVKGENLRIYHSHTNVTPPSSKDLELLCDPRVSEIGNTTINGDTFIVRIGNGIRPEMSEFERINDSIQPDIDKDLMRNPDFWD